MRLIIVIRETDAAAANTAIANATGNPADARTFTVQLARINNPAVPVARVCNWDVEATGRNRAVIAQAVADTLNIPVADLAERLTSSGSIATKRVLVYRADRVNPSETLEAHGLQVI